MLSVGETNFGLLITDRSVATPQYMELLTNLLFAIFFAKRAFMPIPCATLAAPFVALPRGACGTTICAACDGMCMGWMGAEMGESFGVEVVDMAKGFRRFHLKGCFCRDTVVGGGVQKRSRGWEQVPFSCSLYSRSKINLTREDHHVPIPPTCTPV
jgi:hypothetical protein